MRKNCFPCFRSSTLRSGVCRSRAESHLEANRALAQMTLIARSHIIYRYILRLRQNVTYSSGEDRTSPSWRRASRQAWWFATRLRSETKLPKNRFVRGHGGRRPSTRRSRCARLPGGWATLKTPLRAHASANRAGAGSRYVDDSFPGPQPTNKNVGLKTTLVTVFSTAVPATRQRFSTELTLAKRTLNNSILRTLMLLHSTGLHDPPPTGGAITHRKMELTPSVPSSCAQNHPGTWQCRDRDGRDAAG